MKKRLVPSLRFPEFRDAEEWDSTTFGAAATFINGKAYKQEELLDQGKYRVLRVGNFFTNKDWYFSDLELEENKYCDRGDLLYAWSASFGPRIWAGEKVIYHYHIWKVVEAKGIDKQFLFVLLDYETERMKATSANGLGLLHITKGAIEGWECWFPKKDEQQKIADCLSSIDALISAQSQKVEALKTHKKGLMQQLFPTDGATIPCLRFPEFRDAGEWEKIPVGKIGEIITGNTPSTTMKEYYGGDRLFVSPADMADHRFIYNTKTTLTELGYSKTRQIPADSILFVCIGSTIGKIAQNKIDCATNQQINAVVPSKNYSNGFIYYSLDLNASKIAELAGKHAVPIINKTVFSTVVLDLPSLKEQQLIAECLSSLDELIKVQSQKLESLKIHKKGLMQQLFPAADGDVI